MYNSQTFNSKVYNTQSLEVGEANQDNIVFNDFGLQNANIVVSKLISDNPPNRVLDIQDIPRGDGQILLNDFWRRKIITMEGFIRTPTSALLESTIDEMKYKTSLREGILQIKVNGEIRQHIATRINEDMFSKREHYHVTMLPFKLVFQCLTPFGTSKNYDSIAWLDQTVLTLQEEVENDGTANASPVIIMNFSAASGVTGLSWTNDTTGQTISIAETISTGDYIRFDGENKVVTLNGAQIDYSGSFPSLEVGVNSFTLTVTGTSATYTHTVKHLKPFY